MGYPIEKIGPNTTLFSLIGEGAIEHKKDSLFNKQFKQLDVDCKMMALNIRQDDIGFFLNGLKDSHIKAAYFEKEYWHVLYNLLPCEDKEIKFCGICDTIDIEHNSYKMSLSIGDAIVELLDDVSDKTITIVGSSPIAKSTLFNLIKKSPKKIVLADEVVENLIDMLNIIPSSIKHDVVRVENSEVSNLSDKVLNFTNFKAKSDIDINRDFDKIQEKIAEINSKRWSEKWTI